MIRTLNKFLIKIFIFIFIISGCICIVASAQDGDEYDAMDVLRILEIIPDNYDYNTNMDDTVTRAEFVYATANLIKCRDYDSDYTYYYDVNRSYWAYSEICAMTNAHIINGTAEKMFDPEGTISASEAYKILLTALGYDKNAENSGGYPNGYISTAFSLGLGDKIKSTDKLTKADMFRILYYSATVNIFEPTTVEGNNTIKYEVAEGKTLLTLYHDVYYDKDILNGNKGCFLSDIVVLDENTVVLGDEIYSSTLDISQYLGEEMEFFYHYDKNTNEKKLLWAKATGKTEVINIKVNDNAEFDSLNYKLTYTDDKGNRNKTLNISRGIKVLYNGKILKSDLDEAFGARRYNAKFIKDENGDYSTAVVFAYKNIVVGSKDRINKTVYDKNNSGLSLSLDEDLYSYINISLNQKEGCSFDDIQVGNVISAFASKDNTYLKTLISSEQISGKLEKAEDGDKGKYLTVNGTEYYMPSDSCGNASAGDDVLLYLDTFGNVAYVTASNGDTVAAYFIKAYINSDEDYLGIKLFTENGEVHTYECSDRVKLDGKSFSANSEFYNEYLSSEKFPPQIVCIKLSGDKKISKIDTVNKTAAEDDNSLQVNIPYKTNLLHKAFGTIGACSLIDENTKIFSVPSDNQLKYNTYKDSDFVMLKNSQLTEDESVSMESYKTREKVSVEQYILIKGRNNFDYGNDMPILVSGISRSINSEDETVECLDGFQGRNKVSAKAVAELSFESMGITKGCLVRVRYDSKNDIVGAEILYDNNDPTKYKSNSDDTNYKYRSTVGYVHDVIDSVIQIGYESGSNIDQVMFGNKDGLGGVLIYDSANSKSPIQVGTVNDAKTYVNAGDNCDRVVMISTYTYPHMFVIYKTQ